jgi:hypothetical protein
MKKSPSPAPRTRSPAYPAIGLPEAVNTVRALYHAIQNNLVPQEVIAQALGMTPRGSTLIGRLSALRKFGLLETRSVGADRPKSYRLTKLARALATLPADSAEWLQAARDAAGRPAIYRELWEKFGPNFPLPPTMSNYLLQQRGFNLRAVSSMLGDFLATMEYAKISGAIESPQRPDFNDELTFPQSVEAWSLRDYTPRSPLEEDLRAPRGGANPFVLGTAPHPPREAAADAQYFTITLPGLRELRFVCPMSEDEWDLVQAALKVWKDQIVGVPTGP